MSQPLKLKVLNHLRSLTVFNLSPTEHADHEKLMRAINRGEIALRAVRASAFFPDGVDAIEGELEPQPTQGDPGPPPTIAPETLITNDIEDAQETMSIAEQEVGSVEDVLGTSPE